MLQRMPFYLSFNVVALHLDNSTANAYLCNKGSKLSLFLSRPVCHILNLVEKHGIAIIPMYIPNHFIVEAYYLLQ